MVLEDITYAEVNMAHIMDLSHKFKCHGSFGADSSCLSMHAVDLPILCDLAGLVSRLP